MRDDLDLIDAKEAADLASVTRRTISRWAESGRLPIAMEARGQEGKVAVRLFRRADVLDAADAKAGAA